MAEVTFRPRELLQVLSDHGVKFVIIGGFAVSAHGHPRATRDLDVVPEPSAENMQRLAAAIEKLDGHLVGVDADLLGIQLDAETFAEGANFPLDTTYGRLDILQEMRDQKLHGQIAQDAIEVSIDGVQVLVCSLRALRELKQAAGRPQDIADLEALAGNEG